MKTSTRQPRLKLALLALAIGIAIGAPLIPGPLGEALAPRALAAPHALAPQTKVDGGVMVTVTPREAADGKTWEFQVALNTHSGSLSQDLAKIAYLVDPATGARQAPLTWRGSAPRGHHRRGVLSFGPLPANTHSLQLHIDEVGGIASRSFVWQLK